MRDHCSLALTHLPSLSLSYATPKRPHLQPVTKLPLRNAAPASTRHTARQLSSSHSALKPELKPAQYVKGSGYTMNSQGIRRDKRVGNRPCL